MNLNETPLALTIEGLQYSYKSDWTAKKFHALKGFDLKVYQGECFGFLGHNGAGKTTTIKCILGLIKASRGRISIFGVDHRQTQARNSVGYLPEQPYFYDYLTVYEIMQMYAVLSGVGAESIPSYIERALDLVKVSARAKSPMRSLSKGLTQRVAMAQAIVAKPRFLVLDEPFSGLDPIGRKEFKDLLLLLKAEGTTIFMSSHILSDVADICDRASIMAYGELKSVFSIDEVPKLVGGGFELLVHSSQDLESKVNGLYIDKQSDARCSKYIFSEKDKAITALHHALHLQVNIESFQYVHGNLEDLFVKLVKFNEASGKAT